MKRLNIWFPFFVGDYRAETQGLSHEERGIFIDLLCAYVHRQQPLPDDDRQLAKICGLTPQKWKKVRPSIAPIFTINKGVWTFPRLDDQIARGIEISEKRSAAGRIGGLKSAAQRQANAQANASKKSKQVLKHPQSQSQSQYLPEYLATGGGVVDEKTGELVDFPHGEGGSKK